MNPSYSLAYSRAGSGEKFISAHRDHVIAAAVALGIYGLAIWLGSLGGHRSYGPVMKQVALFHTVTVAIHDDIEQPVITDESRSDQIRNETNQSRENVSELQPPPPNTPSSLERPDVTVPSIERQAIIIPAGLSSVPGSAAARGPFEAGDLDRLPVPVFRAEPVYPRMLKAQGVSGRAIVDFIVDRDGLVRGAYASSASSRNFGLSAVQALSRWKFKPGMKGGRAVDVHLQVPVDFNITNP
jgi:TonB family protein